jgi:hypothetical protein
VKKQKLVKHTAVLFAPTDMYKLIYHEVHKSTAALRLLNFQNLAHLNLIVLKNLAHLNGLNTIQFAVVFYDQGAIYLY